MKIDHLRQFSPQISALAKKYRISRIFVFGSAARGDSSHRSDVDLLVEMEAGASLFGVAGFGYEAEELLGVPVDVVPLSVLSHVSDQDFVANLQKEAVPL